MRTQLNARQIRLEQIFSVQRLLASRGFLIKSECNEKDTLLTSIWTDDDVDLIYKIFDEIVLRNALLISVSDKKISQQTPEIVKGLCTKQNFKFDRQAFSTTFEWYVGELMRRRFQAFSSSFGVTIQDVCRNLDDETAGDYDVLSILGNTEILYIECKTGEHPTRQKILNVIERSLSLHCIASVILLGTSININQLKQQLDGQIYPTLEGSLEILKLQIKDVSNSAVYQWHDCYFVEANEHGGQIEARLKTVLRLVAARQVESYRGFGFDADHYRRIGYQCDVI
jgi:hypothetical protein